ncbi:MAG: hypothetical protein NWF08_01700 [Candidatus Bathyarchaeota archaeon]|nr:hypothetical protein [Candidatus Bathyarchaeota archaeon]
MSKFDINSFKSNPLFFGPSNIVYWSRFFLGIIAALVCFTFKLKGASGINVLLIFYMISYIVFRNILHYGEEELKGKHKVLTLGVGTCIFIWAALWILLYTLYPY